MYQSTYKTWLNNFFHAGPHGVSTPKPPPMPVAPPPPPVQDTPGTQPGGQTQVGGGVGGVMPGTNGTVGMGAAGFFVAGFGADFFNQYNPMMSGLAQMGMQHMFNCGVGGGFGMGQGPMMPQPKPMEISNNKDIKHCGIKAGIKNSLKVGDNKFEDFGHGKFQITGKDGKKFTIDVARCKKPEPQIEIHANGDKTKPAMMKVNIKDLQKGGSLTLPDGTTLNMKGNKAGNNIEQFQVVSPGGEVATMDKFDKGNAEWKTGGQAMKVEGPKLGANAGFDKITKGGARPNPGQIAQGNFNHLNPMGQFMQPFLNPMGMMNPMGGMPGMNPMGGMPGMGMPGMGALPQTQAMPGMGMPGMNPGMMGHPNPQMQRAGQMLNMVFNMIQLFSQMAQMFQQVGGSRFNMIR